MGFLLLENQVSLKNAVRIRSGSNITAPAHRELVRLETDG